MPECGYCKDCKHWNSEGYGEVPNEGVCQRITYENYQYASGENNAELVSSSGNYEDPESEIHTEPLFGCVLFEAKT